MQLFLTITVGILLFSTGLIPVIILFCKKYSLYDSVNARKIHSGNISRLGGIAIFLSFVLGYVIYFCINDFSNLASRLPLLLAASVIFITGIIDDLFELNAWIKLSSQLIATALVVIGGYRFQSFFGIPLYTSVIGRFFSCAITFAWVVGVVNSYNLIDGLDGLCGTLALTVFASTAIIYTTTFPEGSIICVFMCSAILGFLLFNWPPAKIFMGDCGSQFLGFMVAVLPLCIKSHQSEALEFNRFLVVINFAAIPLTDTVAAIWRRIRDKRPIMSPDKSHLHHKLLNLGFSKRNALILVDTVQILICIIVVTSLYFDKISAMIILLLTYFVVMSLFCMIHFTNRSVLKRQRTRVLREVLKEEKERSSPKG